MLIYPDYGKPISPALVEAYAGFLADLDLGTLKAGLLAAGRTCSRFPTPADVRNCAETILGERLTMEAEAALADIDHLIDRSGCEWAKAPKGIAGLALQSIGGLRTYGCRTAKESPFMRREFVEAFKRYSKADLLDRDGEALGGELPRQIRESRQERDQIKAALTSGVRSIT